jgi:hypothetical protein
MEARVGKSLARLLALLGRDAVLGASK